MKRTMLAAALALAAVLTFSDVASARWGYYGPWYSNYPYAVTTGGAYRTVPGPVPYSTLMVPDVPTTTWIGPRGHIHYAQPVVTTNPYWYY
jgi:hypothetical protein